MKKPAILILGCTEAELQGLSHCLPKHGFQTNEKSIPTHINGTLPWRHPDLAIIGSDRDDAAREIELAEQIRRLDQNVPLILITLHSTEAHAIAALRAGINDYLKPPLSCADVVESIGHKLPAPRQSSSVVPRIAGSRHLGDAQPLVGESQSMQELRRFIPMVAATDSTVLITGETGTGKELVAELIHQHSPRRGHPLISVNCAAVPDNLLESELFGYEKGAFTGANSSYPGKLKLADGGTFFFDEIGDMSPYAQAKVLRSLESREVYRLGGKTKVALNIRVIAATNRDLERLVAENLFRKDLYFRLNVARIHLPTLRERKEDIPVLFNYYLREMNHNCALEVGGPCSEALACLLHHDWAGNIRELRNLLEAIFICPPEETICMEHLPLWFASRSSGNVDHRSDERELLLSTLFSTNWNKSEAAKKLHWSRMTVYRKMQKYHIQQSKS
jgi:DNA-binding NtrC family response regulator